MQYNYKLEMHLHTFRNSACAKERPRDIAGIYARAGYDGIVCTNHLNRHDLYGYVAPLRKRLFRGAMECWLTDFRELKEECRKVGIDVFFGAELAPDLFTYYKPEHPYAEFLIYGATEDDALRFGEEWLDYDQKTLYEWCEAEGALLVQAHPYREICDVADVRFLHGAEIANLHPGHDSHNDLARKLCEENGLIGTGGSDFHFRGGEGGGVLFPRAPRDEKELAEILVSRDFEVIGTRT